jgi:hypothetical protein
MLEGAARSSYDLICAIRTYLVSPHNCASKFCAINFLMSIFCCFYFSDGSLADTMIKVTSQIMNAISYIYIEVYSLQTAVTYITFAKS